MAPRGLLPPRPNYPDYPVWHHNFDNVEIRAVNATWNGLFEANLEEISFSRIAREVGVTPAAIYHYYPSPTALGAAVASQGCVTLFAEVTNADSWGVARAKPLKEFIEAYLAFAEKRRRHYALLFSPQFSNDELFPEVTRRRLELVTAINNLMVHEVGPGIPVEDTHVFTALLHGSASLVASGFVSHPRPMLQACKQYLDELRARM